jgi:hypothetical protein
MDLQAITYEDRTSASSTLTAAVAYGIQAPSFQMLGQACTITTGATLYIGGNPGNGGNITYTNAYGIWNVGNSRLDGTMLVGSTATFQALVNPAIYTVSTLPSSGRVAGSTAFVSDATVYTPGSAPVGSGSTYAPVFYTGSGWLMY